MVVWRRWKLSITLIILQIVFILIFAFQARYDYTGQAINTDTSSNPAASYYPAFQDVNVMIFVGFGFLMTFLRRYGYSSVAFNYLIAALCVQWSFIVRGFLHQGIESKMKIKLVELMSADFSTAGVLISFGVVLGKLSPLQLIVMAMIEVVFLQVNEWLGFDYLHATDAGESMFVHIFGAYFGLAVSRVVYIKDTQKSTKAGHSYHSDLFSMLGTVFLWMFWPSFNGGSASGDELERAYINTIFSLTASVLITFAMSGLVNRRGKLDIEHVQNCTLAGGVAVGTCAAMNIGVWGAVTIGSVAAVLSVAGLRYLTPLLDRKFHLHDTCGVNNLHGLPGLLAAIAGVIAAAVATEENYGSSLYDVFPARTPVVGNWTDPYPLLVTKGRTAGQQAAFQVYALLMTIGVSIVGGIITGAIINIKFCDNPKGDMLFEDDDFWELPEVDDMSEIPELPELKTMHKLGKDNQGFDNNQTRM